MQLILAAHPDDELIFFGPTLISNIENSTPTMIAIMSDADDGRFSKSTDLADHLRVFVRHLMLTDDYSTRLITLDNQSYAERALLSIIEDYGITSIVTHDPSGEVGRHWHHQDTSNFICWVVKKHNLNIPVYAPYWEGFYSEPVKQNKLNLPQYKRLLSLLCKFYGDEWGSGLDGDYPIRCTNDLVQLSTTLGYNRTVANLYFDEIPSDAFSGVDIWSFATSDYEKFKRDVIVELMQTIPDVSACTLVDFGCNNGESAKYLNKTLNFKHVYGLELATEYQGKHDGIEVFGNYLELPPISGDIVLNFSQVLYYFNGNFESVYAAIEHIKPKYICVDQEEDIADNFLSGLSFVDCKTATKSIFINVNNTHVNELATVDTLHPYKIRILTL